MWKLLESDWLYSSTPPPAPMEFPVPREPIRSIPLSCTASDRGTMYKAAFLLALCVSANFLESAQAWNKTGHTAIATIAYSNLEPKTKQRVDALLRKHPDYKKWVEGITTEKERSRAAFLAAANWPDRIRYDPRFFDDAAQPTPPVQGFADM